MGRRYRFGPFEVDTAQARLTRDGVAVDLQPKVFDALVLFVERRGELLAKEELLAHLWPGVFVGEESLTQAVRKLRQALGDDPQQPRYLETVPRRGYRFVAEVAAADRAAVASEPAAAMRAGAPTPAPTRRGGRRTAWAALAVLGLVGASGAIVDWLRGRELPNPFSAPLAPRRLTATPEREGSPALSPDGRLVAYAANVGAGDGLELFVLAIDAGRPVRLTESELDEWDPRFSPDGRQLAFLRATPAAGLRELWAMPAFGGSERLLAAGVRSADWMPSGEELVVARFVAEEQAWWLERIRPGEAHGRRLARLEAPADRVTVSPDGAWVAFLAARRPWIVATTGGAPTALAPTARQVRALLWESSATLLTDAAFDDGTSRISRLRFDGRPPEVLLTGSPGIHELAFARQGRVVVYTVEHKVRQVFRLVADGTRAQLVSLPTTVEGFDVDAQATRLALTDWDPTPGRSTLAVVELATGGLRTIGDGLCPAISPAGDAVAALGFRAGEMGLRLFDLAGGEARTLVADRREPGRPDAALFRCPRFAPDGDSVAVAVDDGEAEALYLVSRSGRPSRRLASGEFGPPAFSPDGRRLAVCNFEPQPARLELFDLAGGEPTLTPLVCPFRAAPVPENDGSVWLVEEQKTRPVLVRYARDFALAERRPLELPLDPSFWGLFDLRRSADGSWFALIERYESDLFRVARD